MNKEDILLKSRQSNTDEGMEYAENQGRKIGMIAFAVLYAFLAVFNLFFGESSTFHAITALFWVFLAAETFGKYRFTKNKLLLFTTLVEVLASVVSILAYIKAVM